MAAAEPITLRYWNCQGRGQVIRYLLYDSGTPFKDEIVTLDDEGLAALPPGAMGICGYLPVYEGPDGDGGTFRIGQSKVIVQHVAKLLGYVPTSSRESALAGEVYHLVAEDVYSPLLGGIWMGTNSLVGAIPKLRLRLAQLETMLEARGPIDSRPVDYSDVAVLFTVDVIEGVFTPASAAVVLSSCAAVRAVVAHLKERPGVKKARERRVERLTGAPHEPEVLSAFCEREAEALAVEPPDGPLSGRPVA